LVCSSKKRHTRSKRDWSSDVCSSYLHSSPKLDVPPRSGPHHDELFLEQYQLQSDQTRVGSEENHGIAGKYSDRDAPPYHVVRHSHWGVAFLSSVIAGRQNCTVHEQTSDKVSAYYS